MKEVIHLAHETKEIGVDEDGNFYLSWIEEDTLHTVYFDAVVLRVLNHVDEVSSSC